MKSTIENVQTRVAEIENVFLPTIRHDSEVAKDNFNQILLYKEPFDEICSRIDGLESLVSRAKDDLEKLEKQMEIAEDELSIPSKTLSSTLLKSFNTFLKPQTNHPATNLSNGMYKPLEIFKAEDYLEK